MRTEKIHKNKNDAANGGKTECKFMKRTAFISIVGRPNVGKSTLLNAILGEKVAIVSSKPQTTRNRITGILTKGEDQFVFLDTPGIHNPRTKLGDYMVKSAENSIGDCDAVILIADADKPAGNVERAVIERLKKEKIPSILVLNKIDQSDPIKLAETITDYAALHNFDAVVPTSALKGKGVSDVLDEAGKFLREEEWYFSGDEITDQSERRYAAEVIREKMLRLLSKEIPHGTAVVVEEFKDENTLIRIRAEIYCEKSTHKGIILGKNGDMLKKIGTYAREDLERFFGCKVFLDLWVKVKDGWRDRGGYLRDFGYDIKNLK